MKKIICVVACLVVTALCLQVTAWAQTDNGYPAWNSNPEIYQINREPAHATLMPYKVFREDWNGHWYFVYSNQCLIDVWAIRGSTILD